ncbi:MAG: ilvA [Frankiales bacterium]|nr:ilvA [Frankiales bacterium]
MRRSPVHRSDRLSARIGGEVWLKREDLQAVRSYKLRGAYNLISQLTEEERAKGVVCASAGNHAQGLAFACSALRVRGTVFLPRTTPRQKRDRIAALGGHHVRVELVGDTYDEASAAASSRAIAIGATVVPAFDDERTVTGQGTVIAEAIAQLDRVPDVVVVPIGGGGLMAGTVTWLRERHPSVRVIGVEPEGATSLAAAQAAGKPVSLQELDTFVDGAAVRRVGDIPFAVLRHAEVVSVSAGRVCSEMLEYYQVEGIVTEPAGALSAAALGVLELEPGLTVLCVVSGGNNDVSRYAEIVERAAVFEGRKHYFLVEFAQEPGALRNFLDSVLGPDDDITLFEYVKRNNRETGPALVGIELADAADLPGLLQRMEAAPSRIEHLPPDSPLTRFLV